MGGYRFIMKALRHQILVSYILYGRWRTWKSMWVGRCGVSIARGDSQGLLPKRPPGDLRLEPPRVELGPRASREPVQWPLRRRTANPCKTLKKISANPTKSVSDKNRQRTCTKKKRTPHKKSSTNVAKQKHKKERLKTKKICSLKKKFLCSLFDKSPAQPRAGVPGRSGTSPAAAGSGCRGTPSAAATPSSVASGWPAPRYSSAAAWERANAPGVGCWGREGPR